MLEQITLIGNVGRDPELTVTPDGTPVTKFTLAVNKKIKGNEETHWYNCTAWRGLAETIEKYVVKGSTLFIQGDFNTRQYTTRDGKPGLSLDVTVEKFAFAGGKSTHSSDNGETSGK